MQLAESNRAVYFLSDGEIDQDVLMEVIWKVKLTCVIHGVIYVFLWHISTTMGKSNIEADRCIDPQLHPKGGDVVGVCH